MPLQGDAFKMKGGEVNLLISCNTPKPEILLCFVHPSLHIFAIKLREVKLEFLLVVSMRCVSLVRGIFWRLLLKGVFIFSKSVARILLGYFKGMHFEKQGLHS